MNTVAVIETLGRDLRYSLRAMRRNPMFTAIAVVTLSLGIGATTAIFSVVNGVLVRPLPYPQPEALVGVWHSAVFQGVTDSNVNLSAPMFVTYGEQNQTFQEFGVWSSGAATVTGKAEPEQVRTLVVTQGILPAMGVGPVLGRWFSQADDAPGTPETAILTYGYWQRRFGGDKAVIGRSIRMDSRRREVVGVMPQGFRFLNLGLDVILPQRFDRSRLPDSGNFNYQGIARLKPGVTLAQANADVARMLPIWLTTHVVNVVHRKMFETARFAPAVRPLKQDVVGDIGKVLWVLMGTIGMVLVIACANVANLLMVRAEGRQQELAIRAALGAGWCQIARELLVESVTLGLLGGALGVGLAYGGLRLLVAMGPANLPRLAEISIDPLVMAFALAVSLASGLVFGLIPVLKYARRRGDMALQGYLGSGGRTASQSRERHRAQNTLAVVQVALALVLLVGSGLMIRTFQALQSVQPGFTRSEQIQTLRISIPPAAVPEPQRVTRMQNDILDRIAAIPGVTSVAFASALPMETEFWINSSVSAEDKIAEGQIPPIRWAKFVSPGLFKTQGTPLIVGRDFTWSDIYQNREVAIISQNMAREIWGGPSAALGKRIRAGSTGAWCEIIGVVGDVYDAGVDRKAPTIVYWRAGSQGSEAAIPGFVPRAVTFAIRSDRTGTESFLNQVREAVWAVNANLPLANLRTLGEVSNQSMARTSFTLVMLAIAGSMALVLGTVGIYGVLSYAVSQRNREIGIRLALGAQAGELQRMFVRKGLVLAGIGVAIGLGAAAGLTRLMTSLLFGISPLDPLPYTAGALLLAMAAVLASYLPARRASAVDPVEVLKAE